MMMQRHAFADTEALHPRAHADDGSGGFMAKNTGRRHGAVMDFLDVRRANAARGDFHQQFVGANARHRQLLQPQIIHPAVNHRPHRFRNLIGHAAKNLTQRAAPRKPANARSGG